MSHGHSHAHVAGKRALAIALGLIVALMAAEIVFGAFAGSLALLADAGHMLTDAAALGLALGAATFAGRPARGRWTFGFRRLEILAAHVNGITLLVVGVVIVYTGIRRLIEPPTVRGHSLAPNAEFSLPVGTRPIAHSKAWTPGAFQTTDPRR